MTEKRMYRYENWIEAPHSAEVPIGIRQIAIENGLNVTINTETIGFIFKKDTVFFKVESEDYDRIMKFQEDIISTINDYENRL